MSAKRAKFRRKVTYIKESFETKLTTDEYSGTRTLAHQIANFPYGLRLERSYIGMDGGFNAGDTVKVTISKREKGDAR